MDVAGGGDFEVAATAQPGCGHSMLVHGNDLRRAGRPGNKLGKVLGVRWMRVVAHSRVVDLKARGRDGQLFSISTDKGARPWAGPHVYLPSFGPHSAPPNTTA